MYCFPPTNLQCPDRYEHIRPQRGSHSINANWFVTAGASFASCLPGLHFQLAFLHMYRLAQSLTDTNIPCQFPLMAIASGSSCGLRIPVPRWHPPCKLSSFPQQAKSSYINSKVLWFIYALNLNEKVLFLLAMLCRMDPAGKSIRPPPFRSSDCCQEKANGKLRPTNAFT